MHEVSIIEDLIEEIEFQAKAQNAHKVTKIKVKIGKLEELNSDSFHFWFEQLSKGSIAEKATIELLPCDEQGIYLESLEMEIDEESGKDSGQGDCAGSRI